MQTNKNGTKTLDNKKFSIEALQNDCLPNATKRNIAKIIHACIRQPILQNLFYILVTVNVCTLF